MKISIIMPVEENRLTLLQNTIEKYKTLGLEDVEFVFVTRTIEDLKFSIIDSQLIKYEHEGEYFNPSKALNLGVIHAKYDHIIITCPEVIPMTNVLKQLRMTPSVNTVCKVWDADRTNTPKTVLVSTKCRSDTPSMYFLAMFKKEDILKINGWDEDFMLGYAYEDDDFGHRFVRAGLNFVVRDDIEALHQWHQRNSLGTRGAVRNREKLDENDELKVIRPINGLEKE